MPLFQDNLGDEAAEKRKQLAPYDYENLLRKPAIDGTILYPDSTKELLDIEAASDVGNNEDLQTTEKTTIIGAVNELLEDINNILDIETSLNAESGTGEDITTPAVPTDTLLNVLQIIWNKIRQVVNYFSSAISALSSSIASDIATINTRITSIENLGHYVGSFDTYALLPTNTADFTGLITVNDFATVRADETHNDNITRYIVDAIDSSGNITWNYDITYDVDISGKADIDSPALTGTPTAPTAPEGTNNTQIATTAFVQQEKLNIGIVQPNYSLREGFISGTRTMDRYGYVTAELRNGSASGNYYVFVNGIRIFSFPFSGQTGATPISYTFGPLKAGDVISAQMASGSLYTAYIPLDV